MNILWLPINVPKFGNARIYTSGWPKTQKACSHNITSPILPIAMLPYILPYVTMRYYLMFYNYFLSSRSSNITYYLISYITSVFFNLPYHIILHHTLLYHSLLHSRLLYPTLDDYLLTYYEVICYYICYSLCYQLHLPSIL